MCYPEILWIEPYMNLPSTKRALGVPRSQNFTTNSKAINTAFSLSGDPMHNTAALLPELIDDGVRLLVYAGNTDMVCNFIVRTHQFQSTR